MKLKINKEKIISFDIDINGAEANAFMCRLVIISNGIEYGFPCEINNNHISIKLPIISNVIHGLKDNDILKCKIEIFKDGYYLQPWEGTFEVEADDTPKLNIIDVKEEIESNTNKNNIINESSNYLSQANLKNTEKDDFIKFLLRQLKESKTVYKRNRKNIKEKIDRKIHASRNHISENNRVQQKLNLLQEKKAITNTDLKNKNSPEITLESCMSLMSNRGMTKQKSQENLLEKAKEIAGDSISSIYDTLEKLLGINSQKNTIYDMYKKSESLKK
jgi:hypothetical protein